MFVLVIKLVEDVWDSEGITRLYYHVKSIF